MNVHVMFSSQTDYWATPQWLFDELHKEFNFTLDPCASQDNAKCERFYTKKEDGLKQNWGGAKSILQSSIRERDWEMGCQMFNRSEKRKYFMCNAYSGKDRY